MSNIWVFFTEISVQVVSCFSSGLLVFLKLRWAPDMFWGPKPLSDLSNILCPSTYYLLFWLFLLVCTSILVRNYHACLFFTRLPVFQVHSPNTVSELISNSFCPAILYNKFIVLHLSIGLFNVFCNGFYTWCEIGVKIHSYACWWFSQDVLKIPSFHWSAF